jgi:Na+/proline symporter
MLHLSVDQGQLITGVVERHGIQGMWLFWASWLGAFVVPIVFAPLWRKLNFMTDNEFVLFRFPGKSGQILHAFRAAYVGMLVVSLLIAFHLIGITRVTSLYFGIEESTSLLFITLILCLFALKNVFEIKVKTDILHYLIFLIATLLSCFFIWQSSEGWENVTDYLQSRPGQSNLFPEFSEKGNWFSILIFVGIQWWSCNLFDGGGPEMARFTSVKDGKRAVWSGLVPPFLTLVLGSILLIQVLFILSNNESYAVNPEKLYISAIFMHTPEYLKGLIFLGFFGMFITSAEALMNWGASFITIDLYQRYKNQHASKNDLRIFSFSTMVILTLLSSLFAYQINNLETLIKITFSIAAGTAPVYILRWIWYRINAWSQLSAMIGSGTYTLIYPHIHKQLNLNLPFEESRVLVVTILTTLTWVLVTLFTLDQSAEVEIRMSLLKHDMKAFWQRFILAIGIGLVTLLCVIGFWDYVLSN